MDTSRKCGMCSSKEGVQVVHTHRKETKQDWGSFSEKRVPVMRVEEKVRSQIAGVEVERGDNPGQGNCMCSFSFPSCAYTQRA